MLEVIDEILQFFIKYYVCRNITDFPNTRDLDAINIDVIEKCDKLLKEGKTIAIIQLYKIKYRGIMNSKQILENALNLKPQDKIGIIEGKLKGIEFSEIFG